MAGITVPIDGDLSPILKTFGELPGRTQEEMAAVGAVIERDARRGAIARGFAEIEGVSASSAKRAANAVIREMERAAQATKAANEAAAREAAAAMKAAEKAAKEAADQAARDAAAAAREIEQRMAQAGRESAARFGDLKKGATVAFGGIVGDIEDVAGALMALGPYGAAAAAALAGAAVIAGAAWVGSEIVSYLYEAASATGQLTDEQEALTAALERIQMTVGQRVAPEFEKYLMIGTQILLVWGDWIKSLIRSGDEIMKLYEALSPLQRSLITTAFNGFEVASALDKIGDKMLENTGRAEKFVKRLEAVAKAEQAIKEANEKGIEAQKEAGRAAKRAEEEAARDRRRNRERVAAEAARQNKAREDAARKEAEALAAIRGRQARQEIEDDQDLTAQILATDAQMTAEAADNAAKRAAFREAENAKAVAAAEAAAAAEAEAAAQRQAAVQGYVQSSITAAATLAQAVADSAAEGSEAQRNASMVAFRANQAGAIASIGVNTAEAVSKAIAMFGPPPSPLGIAGIATAAALGLAQAAAVAAQAPPTFHTGGMISTNPLAPDETMVVARKGEEIRTRQEQGGGAPVVVQMTYQHRVFDTFIADNMKQTSSPLRREITSRSGRLLGHRERAR